jgi:hypothetical protein
MMYEPVVPSSPAKSSGPSAAEHETITVMAAMTAAAAIAAPKCFVFRIMSFLRLFTGLKYSIYITYIRDLFQPFAMEAHALRANIPKADLGLCLQSEKGVLHPPVGFNALRSHCSLLIAHSSLLIPHC